MNARAYPLGIRVDDTTIGEASAAVMRWAAGAEDRYVCVANVHVVMAAHDDPVLRQVMMDADLVVADGMPLVWFKRLTGRPTAERVYGPALMLHLLRAATLAQVPIGFYGSTAPVLQGLKERLEKELPDLRIACALAPPFRELTPQEDSEMVAEMSASGARIIFVGLGCPKQELWMGTHRRIPAVLLGVGAAFDFLAGTKRQAPPWIGSMGLEWGFRLMNEPGRLWRRYLYHNPRYAVLASAQLLGIWRPRW